MNLSAGEDIGFTGSYAVADEELAVQAGGDVNVRAGGTYEQIGSDVLAPEGDIRVRAKEIRVVEARTTEERWREDKMRQGGITVGLSGGVVQTMQGATETLEALGKTDDARLQALGAATAGLQLKQGIDTAGKAAASGDLADAGISVNISVGSSSSRSRSEASSNNAQGSRLTAGGEIELIAEGAGQDSDILIQGSELNAGKRARLKADDKVELRAAENTTQEKTESRNRSGSVGVGWQIGGTGAGVGFTASASSGKGNAEGESTSYTNTHVRAGEKVIIESGGDTVLAGAVVSADRVEADIGGELLIQSLQDTASYREKSRQSGGSATVGAGAGGSFSASSSNIESEYASVGEQSGIRAGDGGFDVKVQGKTVLKGGAITSTQVAVDEQRNDFHSEGGVELEDVRNEARYKAKSSSATVGGGGQLSSSGAGVGSDSNEASSTTRAGISGIAGHKAARTGDAETGLAPIFDRERVNDEVNAQVVITKGFGQQAVPMVATYADKQAVALRQEGREEEARKWDEGGEYRVGLHAAIGLFTGGAQGAVGAGAGAALVPMAGEAIADLNLPEPVRQAVTQVAGAALGSVGGTAGAAASLNQTAHNYVSRSPYREVNRRVSRENARLTNECGANCTAEDFRRIDQQMAKLESAGTLAEIGKHSTLTPEQANDLAQLAIELAPGYGTGESLMQAMTGRSSVSDEEVSRFWAAVGVVPVAGGVLRRVGEPAVDMLAKVFKEGEAAKGLPPLRQAYVEAVSELKPMADSLRAAGADAEAIARALHAERRAIGEQFKALTPADKLAEIYQRNLHTYGDMLGPSIDWLRAQGKSWDQIIESSTRTGGKDLGF